MREHFEDALIRRQQPPGGGEPLWDNAFVRQRIQMIRNLSQQIQQSINRLRARIFYHRHEWKDDHTESWFENKNLDRIEDDDLSNLPNLNMLPASIPEPKLRPPKAPMIEAYGDEDGKDDKDGKEKEGKGKPNKPDNKVMHYALSEDDIRKIAGDIPIYRYPDIAKFTNPDEMFKGKKAAVLLFLTENADTGHWITVLNHPDHIEVFDSYGTPIDGDRTWLTKAELRRFNEEIPYLTRLLKNAKKPVVHNTTKLQADSADTCGRWAVARILNSEMPLHSFIKNMVGGGASPDVNVTNYTFGLLNK